MRWVELPGRGWHGFDDRSYLAGRIWLANDVWRAEHRAEFVPGSWGSADDAMAAVETLERGH